jgi:alkylation response protein AidB-like acyl-CoA dehydrogenase
MIQFDFTDDQKMLRNMVRDFTNAEIKPIASKMDEEEQMPKELIDKIREVGLLGTVFPTEYGGGGFGEVGYCIAQEEVARGCLATATFIGAHQSIGSNAIYIGGTEELKKKYLVPLAEGKYIGAFGLTETQAGSDSFNLRTKARRDGDDWVITGEKIWITNGPFADIVSIFARTDRGITGFVVETKSPGFKAGAKEKKMGLRASATSTLMLDNVRVPKENIIGDDGRGFLIAMKTLDAGRLGLGACCVGAAKEMMELSAKFSKERKQFDQPISQFQAIQFMLAEMATLIYCMESVVYRTAAAYDRGEPISRYSAAVKLFCSEGLDKIVDMAVQIHGGMGYSRELPIERFYRDSRINRIFEGTSEVQKLIMGREILKRNGAF